MTGHSIIQIIIADPKKIFLVDGIGALLSAFFLGVVLVQFEDSVGVSKDILICLSLAAMVMAVYSLSCYFRFPTKWRLFLKAIAIVNLLYCCVTIGLILLDGETLTILGYLYFIIEILIVVSLVFVELKVARI